MRSDKEDADWPSANQTVILTPNLILTTGENVCLSMPFDPLIVSDNA